MEFFFLRNPAIVMVARGDAYYFVRPDGDPFVIAPADVERLSRFMQVSAKPMSEMQVNELLDPATKAILCEQKILLHAPQPVLQMLVPAKRSSPPPCQHLVLGIAGAISSVQVVPLVLDLLSGFAERIDVILTDGASHFVNPEALSFMGVHPWADPFEARGTINVPHIYLAETAKLIVVLPASAHTLQRLAHGVCSDLLSLVVAATEAPVVLFPAMNRTMWSNPAIRRNVGQLRADGFYVVEPALGREVAHIEDQELSYGVAGFAGFELGDLLQRILSLHKRPAPSMSHRASG